MRLVLRVMAASALIVMAYATQVSAQTGFANMFDHLHLAAPDPVKAVEWYRKNLGGQPMTEGNDRDRKSTRLNSSHSQISYAVFCLKKKKKKIKQNDILKYVNKI